MTAKRNPCLRDTNEDDDCPRCDDIGCPFVVFRHAMVDRAVMSDAEAAAFKAESERFEYTEPWLGTIRGYRRSDGKVLIEKCEPE